MDNESTDEEYVDLEELFMDVDGKQPAQVKPKERDALEDLDIEELLSPVKKVVSAALDPGVSENVDDDEQTALAFLQDTGLKVESRDGMGDLTKPWMKFHKFVLVKTIDEVRELVDRAIKHGRCALDLETEGLDNRIDYEQGQPHTRHRIVGYCISVKGVGYYLPIRHVFDQYDPDPNLPLDETNAEIKRLCEASQPVITPEGREKDPYGSPSIEVPSRCVIYFWNAEFDQEFLYPVCGIDFWHPESFEDGYLAAYVVYTNDKNLGLKNKASRNCRVKDPKTGLEHLYEMIKFEHLFPKGTPRHERRFATLYPEDPNEHPTRSNCVKYGCSDAICTELLCEAKKIRWDHAVEGLEYRYDEVLSEALKPKFRTTYRLEKQTIQAVRVMERSRTLVDKKAIKDLLEEAVKERSYYEERIVRLAEGKGFNNFNPSSPIQLSEFLFGERGLDIKPKPDKTDKSSQYKTDASTLEALVEENPDAPDILRDIVRYRQVDKIIGTYLSGLEHNTDEHNQLRFNFRSTGAQTGRFTAPGGDPEHGYAGIPIQGIPARNDPNKPKVAHSLRRMFVSHPGYTMVKIDYAGQELRVVTCVSGEPVWKKEFLEGSGDLHTLTAQAFFGSHITKANEIERTAGKIANFSLIYGGGIQAIVRATKGDKVEAARKKASFDKSFPTFAVWVKKQHDFVKKHKGVYTGFRRFISIPDASVKVGDVDERGNVYDNQRVSKVRAACERKSTNFPIQGCIQESCQVLTRVGWAAIGELERSQKGFVVWTGTEWAEASAHDMGGCELADVVLSDGTIIHGDVRHKLLVVSDEGYSWVEYPDLEPGMAVATSLCEPVEFESPRMPKMGHRSRARYSPVIAPSQRQSLWYWIGRYIGDDWLDETRGALIYSFGDHELEAVERCMAFWREAGLNPTTVTNTHTPHTKESTRFRVEVWSVDLNDWLNKSGITQSTTHTKRVPSRIFSETLEHRRAFLRGVMGSGHKPKLPQKIDGVWEIDKKGNPYNVHLCQRPLLEDLKLVLRSTGVESVIRGSYKSGSDKNGDDTTSYRLDLNRRMYERNVMGREGVRHPKFHDMFAPQFLVDEFLAYGPFAKDSFNGDESAYNLWLRLTKGGRVTVYTLKRLCELLKVKLNSPIYGFKRIVSKKQLGVFEHTYTLTVDDPLHRFEADGVITKNSGADILKISLVKLVKLLHRKGWLKRDGDDSVRMLMTIHDEIVFEVRNDRLMEAVPEIVHIMESPAQLVKWDIPLIVEPSLGCSWNAKHDWLKIMKGKEEVPDWLQGHVYAKADWKLEGVTTELPQPQPQPKPAEVAEVLPKNEPIPIKESEIAPVIDLAEARKARQIAVFAIPKSYLTEQSIRLVAQAIDGARPIGTETSFNQFKRLRVEDSQGHVLIDPKLGIRVDPEEFGRGLRQRNLGPGTYDLTGDLN